VFHGILTPRDFFLQRLHRHLGIGAHLLAGLQRLLGSALLNAHFSFDDGDTRARLFGIDQEHSPDDRHRHVLRLHVEMAGGLRRGVDDDAAAAEANPDSISRAFHAELGVRAHLDARSVRQGEHRACVAGPDRVADESLAFDDPEQTVIMRPRHDGRCDSQKHRRSG
jgi:hypothetical protein